MKFRKLSQLALVSAIGLGVATLLTSCQLVTIDYVFVAASAGTTAGSAGQLYGYAVDAQSGAIRSAIPPVASGGTNPVALATTSDYYHLYAANQGNNTVVHFNVASSGLLTESGSIDLSPATPVAIAVNPANTYLYVVSYQPSNSANTATLTEYALSNGAIGSATASVALSLNCSNATSTNNVPYYPGDVMAPTAVTVLANGSAVFVAAYDQSAYNPGGTVTSGNTNPGWIFGLKIGSSGVLTSAANNCVNTATGSSTYQYDLYQAGVKPSSLATDPVSRFVFATDYPNNGLIGYSVLSSDALQYMINGPFKTGNEPTAAIIDPRGIYLYVTNSLDNTVSAYSIALPTGTPSTVVNATSTTGNATDSDPVAIAIEPSLGRFIYTANRLANTISGFRLNPNTGTITGIQAQPYPTGAYPTAIVTVPHGNHATEAVTP